MTDINIDGYIKENKISILVKPNSGKTEITGYDESRKAIRVNIRAPPENNRANLEVIKFFSRETGKEVKIILGLTSKKKVLRFL